MLSFVGWFATALFAGSYLFREPKALTMMQGIAAMVWIAYGLLIGATPVVVCNVAVATMAAFSAYRFSTQATEKEKVAA